VPLALPHFQQAILSKRPFSKIASGKLEPNRKSDFLENVRKGLSSEAAWSFCRPTNTVVISSEE